MNCIMSRLALLLVALLLAVRSGDADERNHKKRQIYREQVLPHAGGRIPETAFETDRLFLNRLQKEGIAIPDGIVLEQRNPQVYPYTAKSSRSVLRIALSTDGRYTPEAGRYRHRGIPAIDTTYLNPPLYGQKRRVPQPRPAYPVYRPFQLHNNQLNPKRFHAKPKGVPKAERSSRFYTGESYQKVNVANPASGSAGAPVVTTKQQQQLNAAAAKFYLPYYDKPSIFNDEFDDLFGNFENASPPTPSRHSHAY